jgi:hypothetical protein
MILDIVFISNPTSKPRRGDMILARQYNGDQVIGKQD